MAGPTSPRDSKQWHDPAPLSWSNPTEWSRKLAEVANGIMQGRTNNRGLITLSAGTTTVLTDERLAGSSIITFMPVTAVGASLAAGTFVTALGKGTATLNHPTPSSGTQILNYVIWS